MQLELSEETEDELSWCSKGVMLDLIIPPRPYFIRVKLSVDMASGIRLVLFMLLRKQGNTEGGVGGGGGGSVGCVTTIQ